MNTLSTIQELVRAIRNLIRSEVVAEVDTVQGLCRVQSGGIQTTWLNWLTTRAGQTIEKVTLIEPNAGTLRGVSLAAVAQSEVDVLIKVLPRMTYPVLTVQELTAMNLPDMLKVIDFLLPASAE